MYGREHEAPLPDPLAYFITCVTYGTWLPGEKRGWIEQRHGWRLPNPVLELESAARIAEDACRLDTEQRSQVEDQVAETCGIRGWLLRAINCRSNHLHVVVTADCHPKQIRGQLKAWCTRRLKELEIRRRGVSGAELVRKNWWAERGSIRYVNDEDSLEAAILYVRDAQDKPRDY